MFLRYSHLPFSCLTACISIYVVMHIRQGIIIKHNKIFKDIKSLSKSSLEKLHARGSNILQQELAY